LQYFDKYVKPKLNESEEEHIEEVSGDDLTKMAADMPF